MVEENRYKDAFVFWNYSITVVPYYLVSWTQWKLFINLNAGRANNSLVVHMDRIMTYVFTGYVFIHPC